MNEQALLDSYELFKSGGYPGSLEDYKVLMANNEKALNDSYEIFKSKGYNKSRYDFISLIGARELTSEEKYDNATMLTPEDEKAVDTQISKISFEPTERVKIYGVGRNQRPIVETFQPHEEELKIAKEQLEREGVKKGEEITQEQIQKRALEIIRKAKVLDIKKQKNKAYLTDFPEAEKTSIKDKKIEELQDINRNFKNDYDVLEKTNDQYINSIDYKNYVSLTNALSDPDYKIDLSYARKKGEKIVQLQNGKEISESLYEEYQRLQKNHIEQVSFISSLAEDLESKIEKAPQLYQDIDFLKRNYDMLDNLSDILYIRGGQAGINIYKGITNLAELMTPEGLTGVYKETNDNINAVIKESNRILDEDYAYGVEFENAFNSWENLGEFTAKSLAGQSGTLLMLATGNAGLVGLGASSYGQTIADIEILDAENGTTTSNLEKRLTALGYAGLEVGLGSIPTIRLLGKSASQLAQNEARSFYKGVGDYIKKNYKQIPDAFTTEFVSEGATQFFQNSIDIVRGAKNVQDIWEGVGEAAVTGGMLGVTLSSTPVIKGAAFSAFSDYGKYNEFRKNAAEIAALNKEIAGMDGRTKAARIKRQRVQELTDTNSEILDGIENNISNKLTPDGFNLFQSVTTEQEQIRTEAEAISKRDDLGSEAKRKELQKLQVRFDALQSQRNMFKNDFKNIFSIETKAVQQKYTDLAKQELAGEDITDGDKINKKAQELYTKDKAKDRNQKAINAIKALGGAGIVNKYEYSENNKELLDLLKESLDNQVEAGLLTEKEAAKQFKEAQRGINSGKANGFNIPVIDKKGRIKSYNIYVSQENALKKGKTETPIHEIGHSIFIESLGQNPENYVSLANGILQYLAKNNSAAFNRITAATADQTADEILTNFLEEVSSGRLDLEAKNNRNFVATLGLALRNLFSKTTGVQDAVTFEGITDIAEFLTTLGKKLAEGTLSVEDVKTIQKEGIAQKKARDLKRAKPKLFKSEQADIQEALNALEDQLNAGELDYDTYEQKIEALERKQIAAIEKEEVKKEKARKKAKEKKQEDTLSNVSKRSKTILDRIGNNPNGYDFNNPKIYEVLDGLIRAKSRAFKTIAGTVVNLQKNPDFEMENMVQETIAQLLPFIQKFNPKINDSLYGYINSQLANKMKQALKTGRVITGQFTSDVTELKGVAAEETTAIKEEKPTYTKLIDADVFGVNVINSISNKLLSTVRVLRSKLNAAVGKNQNTTPLIAEILSNISTQADIDIKKAMGGKADGELRKFLLKHKKAILENLTTTFLMGKTSKDGSGVKGGIPIAIQKQVGGKFLSYPDWVGKKIDRETTEKRGATAGNEIVRRVPANRISDVDYLDFFLEPTGNPIRGRKEALAKALAGEIGLELFVEAIQSETGPIFEAFEKNQELLGEVLQDNYLGEVNKQVERGTVKFSKQASAAAILELINNNEFINDDSAQSYLKQAYNNLIELDDNASDRKVLQALLPKLNRNEVPLKEQRKLKTRIFTTLLKNNIFDYAKVPAVILKQVAKTLKQQKEITATLTFKQIEDELQKIRKKNRKDPDKADSEITQLLSDFVTLYSRSIRGSKILGITNNQKLYNKLVEIAGEDIVAKTFAIKAVPGGKTLIFKNTNTPVVPFTSTPFLKIKAIDAINSTDPEVAWQNLSDKTRVEAFVARNLIINFIKNNNKKYGEKDTKSKLSLLNGDQSSIIRKLSYWQGYEAGMKANNASIVEHVLENQTILEALFEYADNLKKNSKKSLNKLNKVFKDAVINLISADTDGNLLNTGLQNQARYDAVGVNLVKAEERTLDNFIDETVALGGEINRAIKFSMAADPDVLSKEFNEMLERKTGMKADEKISKARAKQLGKGKGRFDLFLPPNAEDFQGLIYKFLGRGKQGDADFAFFKKFLFDPFNVAENAMSSFRQRLAESLRKLQKELGDIDKDIDAATIKKIEATGFTPDQAVRIFIWNRMGRDIPNLTAKERASLLSIVRRDASLMRYAKELMRITEQFGGYPPPADSWYAGNTKSDLYQYANENVRAKYLENWQANADAIFNADNLIKLEALYGKDFVKNLKEVLRRMKSGSNRPLNLDDSASAMLDYINGSVGTIMFLNVRSSVLQTISSVNFLNWHDNNIFQAGKTLLNLPNFIKTFMEVMNSDFLKQRRDGLQINVSEAEIASAVEQSKNKAKALFSALIKFGYKPTQFADSFAIAIGGTPFLINRTNTYIKSGLDPKAAREKAFTDFRAIAEENQQSSRTDRTSNIQASTQGRLLFAFNNTPFQMTRIMKKAILDLYYNRGDRKTNISKIIYYGAIQNILFYSLQQASMALLFGADDDEEENKNLTEEQLAEKQTNLKNRKSRLLNSVLDGLLRGSGLPGAILSTVKNVIMEYYKQEAKGDWRADHGETIIQALNFSPPLGSKAARIYKGLKGRKFEETTLDVIRNKSKIAAAITNVPVDRLVTKIDNMRVAVNEPIENWKRLALIAGWDQWSLGVYDDLDAIELFVNSNKFNVS